MGVCVKGTGWDLKRMWHLSIFQISCFYVQFVTSWSFLNIPIILRLKYFRTPGPLFFPISYSNLIRSELYDFGPIVFAKFPGQSKGTLCCLEKVIEFQTEQNEKWLSLWPHIVELVLWWELSDQFITVSNWFQAQSHFSSDFWGGLSEDSVDDMNVSVLDNKWFVNPCWGPSCEQFIYFCEEITNEAPKVYRQRSLWRNKIKGAEGWLWEKTLERAAWSSVGDALRNGPKGSWLRSLHEGAAGSRCQRGIFTKSLHDSGTQYHVGAQVAKVWLRTGGILLPSCGAQCNLSVIELQERMVILSF